MDNENFDAPAEKNPGGRPPHEPTPELRAQVETLSGYGIPQEDIAAFIHVCVETLMKYYSEEMTQGRIKADAKVAGSLFKKAISDDHPQSTQSAIWWEKTRAGRRDKLDANVNGTIEHTADDSFASIVAALEIAGRAKAGSAGRTGAVDSGSEAEPTSSA